MQVIEDYLYFIKTVSNVSNSSQEVYKRDIYKFFHYLRKRNYTNVTQDEILRYLKHLKKYSISTARRKISNIKAFFRYLEMQGKIPSSPFNKIYRVIKPGNNHKKQTKPILAREQINKMLTSENELSKMSFEELRNEVIVRLFLATAIRRKELLGLKLTDIDIETNRMVIRAENSKTKTEAEVFFDDTTAQWLKWYIDRRKSHKGYYKQLYLFVTHTGKTIGLGTLRKIIEDRFEKAGLGRKFKCHLFRHTCATMLLENGADPKIVQELLRHKNISTTLNLYVHPSQEHLKKIYKKTNPFKDLQVNIEEVKQTRTSESNQKTNIDFDDDLR